MTNPFIQKAERENPFVVRQGRKRRARNTMLGHVVALEGLLKRMDPGTARERIAARLEEARAGARMYE